jgi:anaerobic selenocysteine-containing dehydrogenase
MVNRYREYGIVAGMHVIKLKPSDIEDLNLKVGDMVDVEQAVVKTSISKELKKKLKIK